ncbi:phage integrase N-terminal SAM-like domain-containing protein [Tolumonas osonensis]|uniref:phage integrase N-terminal SAM-like domain-containing protein n=1 Tax=Tolumonas osonensis TaxID=675874 RepID=UPI003CCDF666
MCFLGFVMRKPSSPFLASIFEYMVTRHYAMNTIEAYIYWIRWFICFHQNTHPSKMGDTEVEQLLSFLVNQHSTRHQCPKPIFRSVIKSSA